MTKILVIIPGVSDLTVIPNIKNNISLLRSSNLDIDIHVYDYKDLDIHNILNVDKVVTGNLNLYSVFIYYNDYVDNYNYILILLDDVELKNFNLEKLIYYHYKYKLDISSPSITIDSVWSHLNMKTKNNNTIDILHSLELFCYLLEPKIYHLWVSIMCKENGYGWYIDTNLYKLLQIKLGLFHNFTAKHLISRMFTEYGDIAINQANDWFDKKGNNIGASKNWNDTIIESYKLQI